MGKRHHFWRWLLCSLCCACCIKGFAQPIGENETNASAAYDIAAPREITIRKITIRGNEVTREAVIRRELPFREGMRVPVSDINKLFEQARINVNNTQLFLEVATTITHATETTMDVEVQVKERWYVFPLPYFKLVDRNFNQWWNEQNRSLERVNYGVKLYWNNLTGHNDNLRINYVNGYSRNFLLEYEMPFLDKKMEKGFSFSTGYLQSRQMQYATDADKQIFYPANNDAIGPFIRTTFRTQAAFTLRKGVHHRYAFRLAYVADRIPDTIHHLIEDNSIKGFNPFYANNGSQQRYFEVGYHYQYYAVDNIVYPLSGKAFTASLVQRGLGNKAVHMWQFNGKAGRYIAFNPQKTTTLGFQAYGMLKLPFRQPYVNMPALGYGDWFLRGLEYYVIDGVMAGILKTTLRQQFFMLRMPTPLVHSIKYRSIPFRVLLKVYGDIGGVHNPSFNTSALSNRLLYTAGAGVDILSYYDFVARFEYSFNQMGEKGLFLHLLKEF